MKYTPLSILLLVGCTPVTGGTSEGPATDTTVATTTEGVPLADLPNDSTVGTTAAAETTSEATSAGPETGTTSSTATTGEGTDTDSTATSGTTSTMGTSDTSGGTTGDPPDLCGVRPAPFWVSDADTVRRHSGEDGEILGTYDLAVVNRGSTTALDGSLYTAHSGKLYIIEADPTKCIDQNNNGVLVTSQGVDVVEADECILEVMWGTTDDLIASVAVEYALNNSCPQDWPSRIWVSYRRAFDGAIVSKKFWPDGVSDGVTGVLAEDPLPVMGSYVKPLGPVYVIGGSGIMYRPQTQDVDLPPIDPAMPFLARDTVMTYTGNIYVLGGTFSEPNLLLEYNTLANLWNPTHYEPGAVSHAGTTLDAEFLYLSAGCKLQNFSLLWGDGDTLPLGACSVPDLGLATAEVGWGYDLLESELVRFNTGTGAIDLTIPSTMPNMHDTAHEAAQARGL